MSDHDSNKRLKAANGQPVPLKHTGAANLRAYQPPAPIRAHGVAGRYVSRLSFHFIAPLYEHHGVCGSGHVGKSGIVGAVGRKAIRTVRDEATTRIHGGRG